MTGKAISRRAFLKRSANISIAVVGFPYLVPCSALGKAGSVAPSNRITLGFIGTGKQSKHLIESFLRPDTQMLAACDVDKLKLQRALNMAEEYYAEKTGDTYKGCAGYSDFRDLLAREDIDAVVIATPDHWHSIIVIQAAQAGKDIYCEKPLSVTIAEARAMVNVVRRYGRVFQTGSMQRSDRRFRLACELVRNGYIGKIQRVEVNIVSQDHPMFPKACDLPAEPVPDYLDWDRWVGPALWRPYHSELAPHISNDVFPHWRDYKGFGGGMVTDWGAHHFDIAQWGLGMDNSGPVEVIPSDGSDHKYLTYKYANGIIMASVDTGVRGVLFIGTEGKIEVNRTYLRSWPEHLVNQRIGPDQVHLYESNNHYADWLNAIRTRSKPICDIEIGCRSVTVCHLGNIAHELMRPLKWDPEKEVFTGDDQANRLLSKAMRSPWHL